MNPIGRKRPCTGSIFDTPSLKGLTLAVVSECEREAEDFELALQLARDSHNCLPTWS